MYGISPDISRISDQRLCGEWGLGSRGTETPIEDVFLVFPKGCRLGIILVGNAASTPVQKGSIADMSMSHVHKLAKQTYGHNLRFGQPFRTHPTSYLFATL
jgi:hypothetical protein